MLQAFMWMCDTPVLRHIRFEEIFRFLDLPYTKPGGIVDLLLKKNWHCLKIPLYFAASQIDN